MRTKKRNDHLTGKALISKQILSTYSLRKCMERSVWSICKWILGLKGLISSCNNTFPPPHPASPNSCSPWVRVRLIILPWGHFSNKPNMVWLCGGATIILVNCITFRNMIKPQVTFRNIPKLQCSCNSRNKFPSTYNYSLRKHPFLLALRRWGRFARRNICDSATEIPYWWRKISPESGQKCWLVDRAVTLF